MLISEILQANPVTVAPDARLAEVLRVLGRKRVRHVPVVDGDRLVGIISDRDVKSALGAARDVSAADGERTAGQIMTREPITIAPMFPVEEAARLMVTNKISALPVLESGRLVGIVTETDLLEILSRAMGALEPSSRLDVAVSAGSAAVHDVIRTVEGTGARISSLMTWSPRTGAQDIAVRLATIDPGSAIRALEAKGYTVRDSWRGRRPPGASREGTSGREEARP